MAENLSLQNFDWDAFENEAQGKQNEELVGRVRCYALQFREESR